jgi:hypothetical protein
LCGFGVINYPFDKDIKGSEPSGSLPFLRQAGAV